VPFQLAPKSTTFDDLEWPYHTTSYSINDAYFEAHCENLKEDGRILSAAEAMDSTFRRYKVHTDIHKGSVVTKGASNDSGVVRTSDFFCNFGCHIFGNFKS